MRSLSDAVPIDALKQAVPNCREHVIATDVSSFLKARQKDVPSVCLYVWDEMVHRGRVKRPFKISPIIENKYAGIYPFVRKELKTAPISDAYAVEYFGSIPTASFAEISLVHCLPNDIHIADVEFSDQRRPVPKFDPSAEFRRFKGLHLFDEFLERLKEVARDRNADRISLMVAYPPLYDVFVRHGFRVGDTIMAQQAHALVGSGHSMYLEI